jgi:SEC-C motif
MAKVGRNEPCPCGSGKKYKKCHGGPDSAPPTAALAAMEEWVRETEEIDDRNFERIGSMYDELCSELGAFELISCITAIAALSTAAENRNCMVRLDALLHLAAIHCKGTQQIRVVALDRWPNKLLAHTAISRREDPAEDVAVGNVMTSFGNYRVFLGDSSNPDYYAQDVLDALTRAPQVVDTLRAECLSLLKVSDLLVTRRGYERNAGEPESEASDAWLPSSDEELWDLSRTVLVGGNDLIDIGAATDYLQPFVVPFEEFRKAAQRRTMRTVRRQPLLLVGDQYVVVHPTAISWAITAHVFTSLRQQGLLGGLERNLGALQARRTFRQSTRETTRADFLTRLLPDVNAPSPQYVSQVAFRFDRDKYMHLLFLHDDVYDIEAKGITAHWNPPFKATLAGYITRSSQKLLSEGACTSGLTLLVQGGVWRGCAMRIPEDLPQGCGLQVWSSADLDRLMTNDRRWKILLWKLSLQKAALRRFGVEFQAHSDANLFSMWTHHEYRLIPKTAGLDSPNYVGLGAEFIFDMRQDNRRGTDDHCVYREDRSAWIRVRRLNTRSHFKEDALRRTYGALSTPGPGTLEGVVADGKRAWWIICTTEIPNDHRRDLIYQLWETVVNWFDRISKTFDDLIPELGEINPILTLDISEIEKLEDWTEDGLRAAGANNLPVDVHMIDSSVVIRISVAFLEQAYSPTNEGERHLVAGLIRAALTLAGLGDDAARFDAIQRAILIKDDDRFMHLFLANDARDYLHQFDSEQPELLNDDDIAFSMIHIAQEASLRTPSELTTKEASNEALHKLVDAFWKRIEARLRELDRASVVVTCITNQERLLRDLDIWQRTSRAVLSLHSDREDVLRASQALKEKRDRTQITSRVLVEMAICTCPLENARPASQTDLDYLCSQIVLLIATAAHSDAIRAGFSEPTIKISRLGDFSFGDNFMQVMSPYMTSHFERVHMADVKRYEEWFLPEEQVKKSEEDVFGADFVEAFREEFGISPARLAEVGVLLAEDATERRSVVLTQDFSSVREFLAKAGLSEQEVDGFWNSFVLVPRKTWNSSQKPFTDKDWFPWRFRRRLSLMARPIVDLGNGQVAYAPGFCEDSFRHNVMEAFQGAFEPEYFVKGRMKTYCGVADDRRGGEFNGATGTVFESEGWNVRTQVEMTELGASAEKGMGDVDVLA